LVYLRTAAEQVDRQVVAHQPRSPCIYHPRFRAVDRADAQLRRGI